MFNVLQGKKSHSCYYGLKDLLEISGVIGPKAQIPIFLKIWVFFFNRFQRAKERGK